MRPATKALYLELIQELQTTFPDKENVTTTEIGNFRKNSVKFSTIPSVFFSLNATGVRGVYSIMNCEDGESPSVETQIKSAIKQVLPVETDEEISARINQRFHVLSLMSTASASGMNRSLIVSGPAGLGKTVTVEEAIKNVKEERRVTISGSITATGLFRTLYEYRRKGCVVVFDDCDSVFSDMNALNFLKAACDSGDRRCITKMSEYEMFDTNGNEIPKSFEFCAAVIFITNLDFDDIIAKGGKMAPHFEALRSRSHYVNLSIKSNRDYLIRIKQVVFGSDMLSDVEEVDRSHIMSFIELNQNNLQELSLRMVKKIADLVRMAPTEWRTIASVTCLK